MKSAGPCDELGRVWPVDPPAIRYPQGVWRGRCLLIFFLSLASYWGERNSCGVSHGVLGPHGLLACVWWKSSKPGLKVRSPSASLQSWLHPQPVWFLEISLSLYIPIKSCKILMILPMPRMGKPCTTSTPLRPKSTPWISPLARSPTAVLWWRALTSRPPAFRMGRSPMGKRWEEG